MKNKILKILFLILAICFAIPSIVFWITNGTIYKFNDFFHFFINGKNIELQAAVFVIMLILITIVYLLIIKKQNKIFKDIKEMIIFIALTSLIYAVVVPYTSSDVFYYMGTGTLESKYGQNPYYTSMKGYTQENFEKIENDEIILKGLKNWGDQKVVYGPVWTITCKILTTISMWNINLGLVCFKVFNILLHLLNCYIIYLITKKKKFVLLYGLNPLILLEGIVNVHNDMLLITLILGSIYFAYKKKKILLSILFLALATAVKYVAILLLPFLIIYNYRKENTLVRLKQCIKYGLIFVGIVLASYLIYFQDFQVFNGLNAQQHKHANSISLMLCLYADGLKYIEIYRTITLACFTVLFAIICIKMIRTKNIKFINIMKKLNLAILVFLFIVITNFQAWYLIWLYPVIMWQKSIMINQIIGMSILSQILYSVFMIFGEHYSNGSAYFAIMLTGSVSIFICNLAIKKIRMKKIKNLS